MNRILYTIGFIFLLRLGVSAQVIFTTDDPATVEPSAILHLYSEDPATNGYKGFLMPYLTTIQALNIGNAAEGLIYYDISANAYTFFNGTDWHRLGQVASGTAASPNNTANLFFDTDAAAGSQLQYYNGSGWRTFIVGSSITP